MKTFKQLALIIFVTAFAAQAAASLIAHDSFLTGGSDYTVGSTTTLSGQGPAVAGFTGNWSLTGDTSANSVNTRLNATSLTLNGYGSGGAVESYRNGTGGGGEYLNHREFASAPQIVAGESLYFSALVNVKSGYYAGVGMRFEKRGQFGVGFNASGQAGVWSNGPNEDDRASISFLNTTVGSYSADTTYLLVGKMDAVASGSSTNSETITLVGVYGVGDTISEGSLLTTTADVYFSEDDVPGNFTGQTLKNASMIFPKSDDGVIATVDEIRYGTDFDSVTPIPEPGTLALVGITLLVLIGFRRRK